MKKTSVFCVVIVLMLLLNCICLSNQKEELEIKEQNPNLEGQTPKLMTSVEELSMELEMIPCEEIPELDSQTNELDMNIDYGLLMALAIADGDYSQAMMYNEHLGIESNLNYDDLFLLSKIVYAEAGSSWLTEEHRLLVASVVINRMHSSEFPNTIYEVIYQEGQYSPVEKKGFDELQPSESSVMAAYTILTEGSIAPIDVVYQANFIQGSEIYREIRDDKLGTTYFCYSENRNLYE